MIKLKYILFLILILLCTIVNAAFNPYIKNIERPIYKAADKNWSITQDSLGYLYFGNDAGLLQYNGISWKLSSLKKSSVVRTVHAVDDLIFTGGYEEFGFWKRKQDGNLLYTSISKQLPPNTFKNDDIWRIVDSGSFIYFQSFRSVYVYNKLNSSIVEVNGTSIFFLLKVGDQFYSQKIGDGIYKFDGAKYTFIEGSRIFYDTTVQSILPYGTNKLLIFTSSKGLFIYDGISFVPFSTKINFLSKEINTAILSDDGYYYIGTIVDGIFVMDKQGDLIAHFNIDNQLGNNTVLSLFEDSDRNIWVGLDKGISIIKRFPSLSFFIDDKSKIGACYIAKIYKDNLFVGTNQGLYYTTFSSLNPLVSFSNFKKIKNIQEQVWSLEVIDDKLFCGSNRGLYIIDESLSVNHKFNINTGVFDIFKGSENSIFLGTYTSLMKINLESNQITDFSSINDPIIKIEQDHFGNLWLEHMNKGVYRCQLNLENTQIENFTYFGESDLSSLPYNLHLFKVGGRAALLGNDHFYIYDDIKNSFVPYNLLDSLFHDTKKLDNIYTANNNTFWILSENTAYKAYCNGIDASIINTIDLPYDDISFVKNFERIISLNDSLDFVCLDKGFILSYENLKSKTQFNKILVPEIISFSSINTIDPDTLYYDLEKKISLPFDYNTIKINFFDKSAISSNLYFQYRLNDASDWSEPQKIDNVVFERLPVGQYNFQLRATDYSGNYSQEINLVFKVNNPWYKTWVAYLLYFIIISGIICCTRLYIRKRYRRKHRHIVNELERQKLIRQNLELEGKVKEKNTELINQSTSIIRRNDLMFKIKEELNSFNEKYPNNNFKILFYKINTLLNSNIDSTDDFKSFILKFEEMYPHFFKEISTRYPQLTSSDLKLCACLRLNLGSKDIASLMDITVRAVENNRSRLRKKIGLSSDQNLNEFFISL